MQADFRRAHRIEHVVIVDSRYSFEFEGAALSCAAALVAGLGVMACALLWLAWLAVRQAGTFAALCTCARLMRSRRCSSRTSR